MAIGLPVKANYAAGDILTATNMNDLSGTFNQVATSYGNAAGKNKIINSDFRINQRNFTSVTTDSTFTFDRWRTTINNVTGSTTFTPQVFTPGTAPVSGYEGVNHLRVVTAGQSTGDIESRLNQRIEDVRTFAGQTITLSFWAKAASGTPNVSIEFLQSFGTGGSPSSIVTGSVAANTVKKFALSTSWVRYSHTFTIPSISGKTLGTNNDSYLGLAFYVSGGNATRTDSLGVQNNTFDFWGIQAEAGSIATPFQTASGGSIQGELAMCQRYYWRTQNPALYSVHGTGIALSSTDGYFSIPFPITMRVAPTIIDSANLRILDNTISAYTVSGVFNDQNSATSGYVRAAATGMTAGRAAFLQNNNNTAGYIGFSAEL